MDGKGRLLGLDYLDSGKATEEKHPGSQPAGSKRADEYASRISQDAATLCKRV